jgi:hypothetical protein
MIFANTIPAYDFMTYEIPVANWCQFKLL